MCDIPPRIFIRGRWQERLFMFYIWSTILFVLLFGMTTTKSVYMTIAERADRIQQSGSMLEIFAG